MGNRGMSESWRILKWKRHEKEGGGGLRLMGVIISKHKYTVESHPLLMLLHIHWSFLCRMPHHGWTAKGENLSSTNIVVLMLLSVSIRKKKQKTLQPNCWSVLSSTRVASSHVKVKVRCKKSLFTLTPQKNMAFSLSAFHLSSPRNHKFNINPSMYHFSFFNQQKR